MIGAFLSGAGVVAARLDSRLDQVVGSGGLVGILLCVVCVGVAKANEEKE